MLVLHLEDVPEKLHGRIAQLGAAAQVPLPEETLRLLRQAVDMKRPSSRTNLTRILEQIRRNPIVSAAGTPDSVAMLREDRDR